MSKNIKEYVISEIGKQFSREYEDMWVGVQIWHGDGDKIYFRFTKSKEEMIKELRNWVIQCKDVIEYQIKMDKHRYLINMEKDIFIGEKQMWWNAYRSDERYGAIVSIEATKITL